MAVVRGLFYGWKTRGDRITQFLLAWLVPCWLIFEIIPTKLPHYTLPMYPALAILAAAALSKIEMPEKRLRYEFALPVALAAALNISILGLLASQLPYFWLAPQLQNYAQTRPVILLGYAEPSAIFLLGTHTQIASDADSAIAMFEKTPNAILVTDERQAIAVLDASIKNHIQFDPLRGLMGFNLGRGRQQVLILFTRSPS